MYKVFALLFVSALQAHQIADERGFLSLFDGKTMKGWKSTGGTSGSYFVVDGLLICPADSGRTLYTEKQYSDFILRFEFRMEPGSNNGVAIRAPGTGRASQEGMEIQILDDSHEKYKGQLRPEHYHGSIYGVIPPRTGFLKPAGEWNEQEIAAVGSRIKVTLNGVVILDTDLQIIKDERLLTRHPGVRRRTGHIGLLGHWSRVEFRNLRIREIDTGEP